MADKDDVILKIKEKIAKLDRASAKAYREQLIALNNSNSALETFYNLLEDIDTRIEDQSRGFVGLLNEIQKINEELSKEDKHIRDATRSFRGLESIASKLKDDQKGYTTLNEKQLEQEKSKLKSLADQARAAAEQLAIDKGIVDLAHVNLAFRHDLSEEERAILTAAQGNFSIYERTNKLLEDRIKEEKRINSQLGLTGKLMKGITRIPIVGQFIDAEEALKKMRDTAKDGGGKIATLGAGLKSIGKDIDKGISDPLTILMTLISVMKELDGGAEKFARSMNMTYGEALKFRNEMETVAGVTKTQQLESITAINKQLGTSGKLTKELRGEYTQLTVHAGMTHEELQGITSLTLTNGKTLKQNTNEFISQTKHIAASKGIVLNEKQLMIEISKVSAATTLSLGKNPKELAKAVATAKALGMEMSKLETIADGLLNFESSIEAELSAELLTGKNLNLERARGLALNNDMAGMAEEINKQIGSSADFTKMNRIQQEALAKAVGMNREELAQTLYTQEQLRGASGKEAEERQVLLDQRIEEVGLAQAKKELDEGGFEGLKKQAGIQTEFNQQILELKDVLANSILPIFSRIAGFIRDHMDMVKVIAALYIGIKSTMVVLNAMNLIGLAIDRKRKSTSTKEAGTKVVGGAFGMAAGLGPIGIALVAGIIATGLASLALFSGDDVMSAPPGYGKRTLFGPEGAIQLNDKDTVIAGTNLFGDDVKSSPNKPTQMGEKGEIKVKSEGGDMSALITSINALASRPINVSVQIDGKELILAQAKFPNTQGDANRKNAYRV
jgi:hypothetical protein